MTLGGDSFRVNGNGKNETAVKSPMTALCALAHQLIVAHPLLDGSFAG